MLLGIGPLLGSELFHPRPHLSLLLITEFIRTGRSLHETVNHLGVEPLPVLGRERPRAATVTTAGASVSPPLLPRATLTITWPALLNTLLPLAPATLPPATLITSLAVLLLHLLNRLLAILPAPARTAPPRAPVAILLRLLGGYDGNQTKA